MKASVILKKTVCYLAGLLFIAIGINISKLSGLGISPVSSVPRACEVIWGITLGTASILVYIALVLLQFILLRKRFRPINALGLLLSLGFGYMIDLTGIDPNAFGHLLSWVPHPSLYPLRLLYLAVALGFVGSGVFLYLRPNWIPMPGEGLAGAISTLTGKNFGDCKTAVDTSLILIAIILQVIFLGGLKSFTGENVVVREGTVICAVCVGQVVKFLSRRFTAPVERWLRG